MCFFFCKQKTSYEMRISDWSSDVCSSDLTKAAVKNNYRYRRHYPKITLKIPDATRDCVIDRASARIPALSIKEEKPCGLLSVTAFTKAFSILSISEVGTDRKSTRLNSSH